MSSPETPEEIIRKKNLRIDFLEKQGQWQLFCFELLTSLGELNQGAGISRDVHRLFSITQEYLFRIVQFSSMAFYTINEDDSDFAMLDCFPEESRSVLSEEIDLQIENGTFAWAVHQNKPVLVETSGGGSTLVLHVLATKRRVRGMFAGVFKGRKEFFEENIEFPLSLILQNTANALEGMHLYEMVSEEKKQLESRVHDRTFELEEQANCLQEELGFRKLAEESLKQTKEQLEQALKSKNDFFTNISHEFRTPLNAILGFSELLRMEAEKLNREDMKEDLGTIISAANHLLTLINDILDMSVIRTGEVEINWESLDPEPLINSIVPLVEPLAKKNNNRINCEIGEKLDSVTMDLTRFRQILLNLLGNACKFTKNGSIFLTAFQETDSQGKSLVVQVADTGPGIAPEHLNSIFEEFQQGSLPLNRKRAGTGLGLSISRNLARVMGGDLTVSSEKGSGAKFMLRIPCEKEEAAAPETIYPDKPSLIERMDVEKPTLHLDVNRPFEVLRDYDLALVADESAVTCKLIANFLGKEGFNVREVSSGEELLSLALESYPEVILLGSLNDKSSKEILGTLVGNPDVSPVPVILIKSDTSLDGSSFENIQGVIEQPIQWDLLGSLCRSLKKHKNLPTALLLENDPVSGGFLKRVLARNRWKVCMEAPDLKKIESIKKNPPDLILFNPVSSSNDDEDWRFAEELRRDPVLKNIPIILLCSSGACSDKWAKMKDKFIACIEKGKCTREDLISVMNHSLREPEKMETL